LKEASALISIRAVCIKKFRKPSHEYGRAFILVDYPLFEK